MKPSDVAVVILNWNGRHHLEEYLPSVLKFTPAETAIWVADNGSTDDSLEWLKTHHPQRVKRLSLGENWGFAEGYNRALKEISAEVYVLLNSDVRVSARWIESTLEAMHAHGWSVASPVVVQDVDPERLEHAGAAGGWIDRDGYPFCVGRIFDSCDLVADTPMIDREVFWASGACFFVTSEAWHQAQGFDGSLFAHFEEIDLCWRLKRLGHKVGNHGAVQVRHLGGGTLNVNSPFKTYLNFRNGLLVMLKNREGFWPVFMFRRMLLDGIAAFRMLSQGQWRLFLAVGQAHGALYLRLAKTLLERRRLRLAAPNSGPLQGWWDKSIVWHHFIKGVRTVHDLPDIR